MAKFFKDLVNYVKEAFEPVEESSKPDKGLGSIDVHGERTLEEMFEDTDTDAINLTGLNYDNSDTDNVPTVSALDLINEEKVDCSNYWWCYTEEEQEDVQVFEEIDGDKINAELNKRIENGEFPVIEVPENAMKAIELLNNPDFDFATVANLINKSPAMAGEFLNIVNSSSYSRGVKIQDLRVALPRIGRENVKAMLYLYSTKMSLASSPVLNDFAIKIVEHSYATAIVASYLS